MPTYDVFDEDRYFEPAKENKAVDFNGHLLGLTICEDILHETSKLAKRRYHFSPVENLVKEIASLARVKPNINSWLPNELQKLDRWKSFPFYGRNMLIKLPQSSPDQ